MKNPTLKFMAKSFVNNLINTYMKTINANIDIFNTEDSAIRAFNKAKVKCQLLKSTLGHYFIDRSFEALKDWPTKYKLLNEK